MQKILLAQTTEEMVLAKDVITEEGRVLCGKGTTLTAKLIDRLNKMEITAITVEGSPVGPQKSPEEIIREIENRFSLVNDIPPLHYIKQRLIDKTRQESQ